jgi:4-hydroxy-2-oxoheptanedioate aldolase
VKIVCAWCADEGRPAIIGEKEPLDEPDETIGVCKWHKVIAGFHNATSGYALKMVSQGWQFVTLASDSRFLAAKAAEEAAAVKH